MNKRFSSPKNIIIRLPNWIGDAVMATPTIAGIKLRWQQSKITLFGIEGVLALFENDPSIDSFITLKKEASLKEMTDDIKKKKFDLGILLTNSFSSAWLFWLAGVKNRIGFSKDLRSFLLNDALPYPKSKTSEHMMSTYLRISKKIDAHHESKPQLFLKEEEIQKAKDCLQKLGFEENSILIGMNTDAAYGSSKCWPQERFKKLSEKLLENPKVYLIFFGDKKSMRKVSSICLSLTKRTINLAGRTDIRELMGYIHQCDLFLTNDSGPMHIACALDVTTIALFGSTSPEATGPYNNSIYLHKKVACSPCFKRECPIDFRCMMGIEVGEVYDVLKQQLEKFSEKSWL